MKCSLPIGRSKTTHASLRACGAFHLQGASDELLAKRLILRCKIDITAFALYPLIHIGVTQGLAGLQSRRFLFGGKVAQARKLLASASYGPETLGILFRAFDEAWAVIAPRCENDQSAIEAARVRLASIVLRLAREERPDVSAMRDAAIGLFNQSDRLRLVQSNARDDIHHGG